MVEKANRVRKQLLFEQIVAILAEEPDLDTGANALLACLIQGIDSVDAGLLWLFEPSDGRLTVKAALGYDRDTLRTVRLAPGEAMVGKAFLSGAVSAPPIDVEIGIADLSPTQQELFRRAAQGIAVPRRAICAPLVLREAKLGVLMLESQGEIDFSPSTGADLQALTTLISVYLQNARLNEALKREQQFIQANRLRYESLSILAHDMRTPLTSIKGYATTLLMEDVQFGPDKQREFLGFIDEECDTLVNLIHDLLESSVLDAGGIRLELQPVLLSRLANAVVAQTQHPGSKHRISIDFPEDFPMVEADPDRILQVLRNLLDNAIKYSPRGGLIVILGEVGALEVTISVADPGIGIAPEHLNQLFDKFFRVRPDTGLRTIGSGLGLPIARAIVEAHGGKIWADSQFGQGSTFHFTLPLGQEYQTTGEANEGEHE